MVNTISAKGPLGQPSQALNTKNIVAGKWQWKVMDMDHIAFSGGMLNSKPITIRNFYLSLMSNINATY